MKDKGDADVMKIRSGRRVTKEWGGRGTVRAGPGIPNLCAEDQKSQYPGQRKRSPACSKNTRVEEGGWEE